jgi:hypothetical protein
MAWKHNGRVIKIGKAWVADDNTKHPRGWVNGMLIEKKLWVLYGKMTQHL